MNNINLGESVRDPVWHDLDNHLYFSIYYTNNLINSRIFIQHHFWFPLNELIIHTARNPLMQKIYPLGFNGFNNINLGIL